MNCGREELGKNIWLTKRKLIPQPITKATNTRRTRMRIRSAVVSSLRYPWKNQLRYGSVCPVPFGLASINMATTGVTVIATIQLKPSEIATIEKRDAQYSPAPSVEAAIG